MERIILIVRIILLFEIFLVLLMGLLILSIPQNHVAIDANGNVAPIEDTNCG